MKHKLEILFELTWLLEAEGPSDEERRTNSCSDAFFLKEVEGFVGAASGAAISVAFSCESAVCSRSSSRRRTWYWSRSPGPVEVSSVEDLKQASTSKPDSKLDIIAQVA
jgi:hypothetical protein